MEESVRVSKREDFSDLLSIFRASVILKRVHKICHFLIYPSLFLFPCFVSFFLDFIKLLEGKFYCLLSFFFFFFHFPLLKSNTMVKYNICRKCISRFIIIFIRAIVIRLKVQIFKYNTNLYILSYQIVLNDFLLNF